MMNSKEINDYLDNLEQGFIGTLKLDIELSREWSADFPSLPGVYVFFENDAIVYVGETSSIKRRMGNILRTNNHTLRRKLRDIYSLTEQGINDYMISKMKLAFLPIELGRKELESLIIKNHHPRYNS